MDSGTQRVFAELKKYRLLLRTDAHLPNLCALVAGEAVRGSWWAHPSSHAIFQVDGELANHPDVLMVKLISKQGHLCSPNSLAPGHRHRVCSGAMANRTSFGWRPQVARRR